jgi:hypothetical protein
MKGTVSNMWGKPLTKLYLDEAHGGGLNKVKTLPYNTTYNVYADKAELIAANLWPSDEEIVKFKLTAIKNTARSKASQKAVADHGLVEPTMQNDDLLRLKGAFDVVMSGFSADLQDDEDTIAEARQRAAAFTNLEWPVEAE